MARLYTPIPVGDYLKAVKEMLTSLMPARLATAGLPAITTWTFHGVLENEGAFPQVCIDAKATRHSVGAGGAFKPWYHTEIIVAFAWLATEDGYTHGADMAAIAEALMFNQIGYTNGSGEHWTDVIESTCQVMPAGSDESPKWQGGVSRFVAEGRALHF